MSVVTIPPEQSAIMKVMYKNIADPSSWGNHHTRGWLSWLGFYPKGSWAIDLLTALCIFRLTIFVTLHRKTYTNAYLLNGWKWMDRKRFVNGLSRRFNCYIKHLNGLGNVINGLLWTFNACVKFLSGYLKTFNGKANFFERTVHLLYCTCANSQPPNI